MITTFDDMVIGFDNIFQSGWNQHFLPRPWVQQLAKSTKPGAQKTGMIMMMVMTTMMMMMMMIMMMMTIRNWGCQQISPFLVSFRLFDNPDPVWKQMFDGIFDGILMRASALYKMFETNISRPWSLTKLVLDGNLMEYWMDFYNMIETNICRPWSPLWFLMEIFFALLRPAVSTISRSA